ncbi:MAG: hypothetical protein ABII22_00010 [Candidatus Micrarchaeota archaeon]
MNINGIDLKKVEATKLVLVPYKNIDVNIAVKNMKGENNEAILEFEHDTTFNPGIGNLKFYGEVYVGGTPDEIKKLMDEWKKTRKLPVEMQGIVLDLISSSSCFNGVLVARAINLPSPALPLTARTMLKPKDEKIESGQKK